MKKDREAAEMFIVERRHCNSLQKVCSLTGLVAFSKAWSSISFMTLPVITTEVCRFNASCKHVENAPQRSGPSFTRT